MLRLLLFIVIAAALAAVAVWFANHPGNVVIEFQGRTVQTSVGMLVLAFLAVGLALVVLVELLRWLGSLPGRVRRHRARQRELRGYQALTTGLVAAAAGNIEAARSLHREAERLLPERGSVLLLAAQTAQLEGREEVAHLKFRQMLRNRETELLGLRGLLAQAMRTNDRDEALQLARRAYRRSPTTPWVLTTLFDLLTRAERWDEALRLVGELAAQRLIPEDQARRHRAVLHHMLARSMRDEGRTRQALDEARRGVRLVPGFAPGTLLAVELAQQLGKQRQARRMLADAWQAAPHPDIARALAQLVPNETPEQRLRRVETVLKPLHPDHPELHVAVGELAITAEQWSVARSALERALALEPTVRVYRLLAELERATGNTEAAQEWLTRGADAQPDHAWVCEDTGEVVPEWRPFGGSGRFDVVRWTTPPRFATLQGQEHGPFLVPEKPAEPAPPEAAPDAKAPPAAEPPAAKDEGSTEPPPKPSQPSDRPAAEMAATA